MTNITFVRTRHVYDSYRDFWKLVELAGFPTVYVDEVDISQHNTFIVCPMNGEWRPHINNQHIAKKPVYAHLILWNLERPSGSAGSVGNYAEQCRYLIYGLWENGEKIKIEDGIEIESFGRFIDEVWVSDRQLSHETKHATRYVTLGSHKGLGGPGQDKEYDLVHISYETGRRQTIYYHQNMSDNIGPNCWPPERDEILKRSRFALNIHQDSHPFQEPLRLALFAAYGLPILSENCFDGFPWVNDETIIYNSFDGIVGKLNQMLDNDYEQWKEMGLRAREMMTKEYEFRKMVRQAVSESLSSWR